MTVEQYTAVLDQYELTLSRLPRPRDTTWALHVLSMIPQMRRFIADGRREKAMRWLGFVQGVFWSHGVYSIEEMKGHNYGG